MAKCTEPRCKLCPRMLISHSVYNRKLHYNVVLPHQHPPLTCTSTKVVYIIKCKAHHKTYVGQTIKPVRERVNRHIATIKRGNKRSNMAHHFTGPDCSLTNLTFTPIQQVPTNLTNREAETRLKELETLWIRRLCSIQPWGMNYIERDIEQRTPMLTNLPSICVHTCNLIIMSNTMLFATPTMAPQIHTITQYSHQGTTGSYRQHTCVYDIHKRKRDTYPHTQTLETKKASKPP